MASALTGSTEATSAEPAVRIVNASAGTPRRSSITPRRCAMSARRRGSETPPAARSSSPSARSGCPASQAASAASESRRLRSSSAAVSSADRSSALAAAAYPLRRRARSAERSSSSATSGSGSMAAAARCQARRSACSSPPSASASARWMARRWLKVAPRYTAERTSGWWNHMRPSAMRSSPAASATPNACASTPSARAARKMTAGSPVSSAAAARSSVRVDSGSRRLDQRQWIALGGLDQAVANVPREPGWESFGQQRAGGVGVQSGEPKLLETGCRERMDVVVAGGQQQHHSLRLEPPGSEGERVSRRLVQPLRIVHQADQRPLLGDLREQAQRAHTDQEAVVAVGRGEPEGASKGGRLGAWKPLDMVEHGPGELVKAGEGQLRLRLDAEPPQHAQLPRGTVGGVGEQRRLADTDLAANHECAAAQRARIGKQAVDHRALRMAAVKHSSMVAPHARPATTQAGSGAYRRRRNASRAATASGCRRWASRATRRERRTTAAACGALRAP